ncbi:DUF4229 domain-containing protein [Phycicoccus sp. CSK15P-2]|uniref:DUF4229 domain-containing protein n=1 Tax=Phycicoccus sp. CSK15P-2 TaxID=2807627 RepID=UPI00194DCF0C|nr:DUF4229 domain-containing protein [Phycicoccus sp. CSK15P-2]MBM6404956.1 DUF4229 domain-containing protein [Phycicoccus sp. CSK15P-2]
MNAFLRYTVLRALVFLGCVALLWLLGLRGEDDTLLLVVGAALLSMLVSYVALRRFREDYSAQVATTIERRTAARRERAGDRASDEAEEDAETGARPATEDDDFR